MSKFSTMLVTLRKNKGLSQEKLASDIGVARYTISDWENERTQPDNDSLLDLATYFNVTVDYLLGRTAVRSELDLSKIQDARYIKELLIENEILPEDQNLTEEELNKLFKKIADIYKIVKDK